MSRTRGLKPDWLDDELSVEDSDTRVLSVALILLADDEGRGRASPDVLLSRAFPRKGMTVLARALVGISRHRFVTLYERDGRPYYAIRGWSKHQRVDHPAESRLPGPTDSDVRIFRDWKEFASVSGELAKAFEDLASSTGVLPASRDQISPDLFSFSSLPSLPDQPEKPGSPRARRWRRVPGDWQPKDKHRELAGRERVDFDRELAAFRDHEFAAPRSDADAAFRNWLRNARRFGGGSVGGPAPRNASGALVARVQRLADEERVVTVDAVGEAP
jgi:hypothetical protein